MAILFPKDFLEGLVSSRLFASDNYSVGGALLLKQVQFVGVSLNFVRLHAGVLLPLSSRIFFVSSYVSVVMGRVVHIIKRGGWCL